MAAVALLEESAVEFFITAGRGTEIFAEDEIRDKLSPNCITIRDGKVFFKFLDVNRSNVDGILALKSIERAFVAITEYDNSTFIQNKRTFLDKLMTVLSCKENFTHAKQVLAILVQNGTTKEQRLVHHDDFLPRSVKGHIESSKISKVGDCKQQTCAQKHSIDSRRIRNGNAISEWQTTKPSSNMDEPVSKMPKLDIQCKDSGKTITINSVNSEDDEENVPDESGRQNSSASCTENGKNDVSSSFVNKIHGLSHKEMRDHDDESSLTFRMSIKCSGKVSKWIDLKRLSRDLGWRVVKASGWRVELKQPRVEVCVHISDEYVTAGVPLTRHPLSRRAYMTDAGLRATVAWIMCKQADIKPGDIVLDPLCGKATILMEACSNSQAAYYLGSDRDSSQIATATQNTKRSEMSSSVSLVKADGLKMPYRDSCIDRIVCDAPFNQKHMTSDTPHIFYLKLIREIHRVLRPQGRCVLLTSLEMKDMVLSMVKMSVEGKEKALHTEEIPSYSGNRSFNTSNFEEYRKNYEEPVPLIYVSSHYMKLGETHACIIILNKL